MGEHARQFTGILEMPGLPEVFADGVSLRGMDSEIVEIVYTVRRAVGQEAVLRVRMPRGAFEAARETYRGAGGPRH